MVSVRSSAVRFKNLVLDTLYPGACAMCKERGHWVCPACLPDVTPLNPALCCDRCGHPKSGRRCACREMHPAIVKARAFAAYQGWAIDTVHRIKYHREYHRIPFLIDHMLSALEELGPVDKLVPVPLHRKRQQWRGFNQAELMAKELGRRTGLPVESLLLRVRYTDSQTNRTREQRAANVQRAFAIDPDLTIDPQAHYVLIDDVYTTGATVAACADVLEAAGVKAISVLTATFDLAPRELDRYRSLLRAASPQ